MIAKTSRFGYNKAKEAKIMSKRALQRIAIALDDMSAFEAYNMAHLLTSEVGSVYAMKYHLDVILEDPSIAHRTKQTTGIRAWSDIKSHDIPSSVGRDAAALKCLGFEILTVHASGGSAMVAAAVEHGPLEILGVTVLTSVPEDEADEIYVFGYDTIGTIAEMAHKGGAHGVVTPVQGIQYISDIHVYSDGERSDLMANLRIVTPGIRPAGSLKNDQQLVKTPAGAIAAGSDLLVVGRPVVAAGDPPAVLFQLVEEIEAALVSLDA